MASKKKTVPATGDILTCVREKISCPQFGDDNYGEWGVLSLSKRRIIKRLLDYSVGQEEVIKQLQGEKGMLEMLHEEKCEEIDRQKAEIESLKDKQISKLASASALFEFAKIKDEQQRINNKLKANAIKEFAERLKSRLITVTYMNFNDTIDSLVKEMVGDPNDL